MDSRPALRFRSGSLSASVAEAIARLPAAQQEALERRLGESGRLRLAEVREAAREQRSTATAELPERLFLDRELPWQVAVRGHLAAALAAIPPGEWDAPLRAAVAEALATADQR